MKYRLSRLQGAAGLIWLGLTLLFLAAPLVPVVISSFSGGPAVYITFPPPGYSVAWYTRIPPAYYAALFTSLWVALLSALIAAAAAVPATFYLVRGKFRGQHLLRSLLRMPLQVPWVVMGVALMQFYFLLYDTTGLTLRDNILGLVFAHAVIGFPYVVGSLEPVLERLDPRLEEASCSLGASSFSTLRRITLPVVMPGIVSGMIYATVTSFGNVGVSIFLIGRNTSTLPVEIFYSMQHEPSPMVLAASTLVIAVSALLVWLVQRFAGLDITHGGIKGGG